MSRKLPLLLGITGHRDAQVQDKQGQLDPIKLTEKIKLTLQRWRKEVGNDTPIWLMTGMAVGPDLLAIEAIESLMEESVQWNSLNTDVIPVLPMPREHFLKDFSEADHESQVCCEYYLNKYLHNLIVVTPELAAEDLDYAYHDLNYGQLRNTLYLNQGAFLSRYSNVLIAVWDGQDTDSQGGTADVVKMKCGMTHSAENFIHPSLRNVSRFDGQNGGLVEHIHVTRQSEHSGEPITATFRHFETEENNAATSLYVCHDCTSSKHSALLKSLRQEFSALIHQLKHFNSRQPITASPVDPVNEKGLGEVAGIFAEADLAALTAQKRYRTQIKWFMFTAFIGLMGYEIVSNLLNTAAGIGITLLILLFVATSALLIYWSKKAKHKWHYQLNRMVAEALRLRCFLNLGGVPPTTKPMMPRRYRAIFPIVTQAISVAEMIWWQKNIDLNIADIKKYWVDDQINYLERKLVDTPLSLKESPSWLHAHPKMAMKRFSGISKILFSFALAIGLGMLTMQITLLVANPDFSLTSTVSSCKVIDSSSKIVLGFWCQWNYLIMLAVQFLVMLGGVIALWIELANYQASTAGFESMLQLYLKVQALMAEDQLSDNEMKMLLNELSREAMQEHIEWNFSEAESDLASR
ncbi:hypothetical protein [uncultured Paraglaciecola sp.]|uniref:hypothetical protein n=1 Tax=uncultured Paraglaciecola sp. TaxID=1765024 RepID=UPI0030DB0315|tara:strand:+ start:77530 stop:79434 length:1905 start_codon:yes stop_codon:yes gene_type:complete